MGISSYNISNSMGSNGSVYVNGTAAEEGDFIAIQFTEDSVLAAMTGKMDNSAGLIADAITLTAGTVLYVPCTSVTLTSGACLLIKA